MRGTSNPPPPEVVKALLTCDAVCFDVDSTVITEEGIDVLAAHLGLGPAISELTASAMNGSIPFHTALAQRLDLLRPSLSAIQSCLQAHPLQLTPGFLLLLATLRRHGKRVFLITGGFLQMLYPALLGALDVSVDDCYSNVLIFDERGEYLAFDATQPTSMSGGKGRAVAMIMSGGRGWVERVVMVGDGMTDVEARPPALCMIGYGGVVVREPVKQRCDWFITDWRELMHVFQAADAGATLWHDRTDEAAEAKASSADAAHDHSGSAGDGKEKGRKQMDEAAVGEKKVKEHKLPVAPSPPLQPPASLPSASLPPPTPPPPPSKPPLTAEERRAQAEQAKAAVEAALASFTPRVNSRPSASTSTSSGAVAGLNSPAAMPLATVQSKGEPSQPSVQVVSSDSMDTTSPASNV